MVEEITQANLILTNSLNKEILAQSKKGSQVIFFAEKGDGVKNKAHYSFRQLDIGESWARASSMNYVDTAWFEGLPIQPEMGWEFDRLIPDYVIPFKDYKKVGKKQTVNMFGNPLLSENVDITSGYFEGWLGQNGGSVIKQDMGEGSILTVTWKLVSQIEHNPIALLILNRLIEIMCGKHKVSSSKSVR